MKSLLLVFGVALIINSVLSYYVHRNKHNVEVFDFSLYIIVSAIVIRPLVDGGLEQWPIILISAIIIVPLFFTILPLAIGGIASYVWKDYDTVCNKVQGCSELKKMIKPIKKTITFASIN